MIRRLLSGLEPKSATGASGPLAAGGGSAQKMDLLNFSVGGYRPYLEGSAVAVRLRSSMSHPLFGALAVDGSLHCEPERLSQSFR